MAIFGSMKGKPGAPKNPREVAQAILDKLDPANVSMISDTSCASPPCMRVIHRGQ